MQTTNVMIYLTSYVMFFVLSWINKITKTQRLFNDEGAITSMPGNLIGSHIIGILWLGAVPFILLKQSFMKILLGDQMPGIINILLCMLLFALIISIAYRQSQTLNAKNQRPIGDLNHVSSSVFIRYFIIRVLFLFVYELWFRGFLLFDSISWMGMPAAVALNIFLYALLHIFNSKKEMLACIPFGTLVCLLSISFNAVWPAIILHIGFSLVYEHTIYRSYLYTSKLIRL